MENTNVVNDEEGSCEHSLSEENDVDLSERKDENVTLDTKTVYRPWSSEKVVPQSPGLLDQREHETPIEGNHHETGVLECSINKGETRIKMSNVETAIDKGCNLIKEDAAPVKINPRENHQQRSAETRKNSSVLEENDEIKSQTVDKPCEEVIKARTNQTDPTETNVPVCEHERKDALREETVLQNVSKKFTKEIERKSVKNEETAKDSVSLAFRDDPAITEQAKVVQSLISSEADKVAAKPIGQEFGTETTSRKPPIIERKNGDEVLRNRDVVSDEKSGPSAVDKKSEAALEKRNNIETIVKNLTPCDGKQNPTLQGSSQETFEKKCNAEIRGKQEPSGKAEQSTRTKSIESGEPEQIGTRGLEQSYDADVGFVIQYLLLEVEKQFDVICTANDLKISEQRSNSVQQELKGKPLNPQSTEFEKPLVNYRKSDITCKTNESIKDKEERDSEASLPCPVGLKKPPLGKDAEEVKSKSLPNKLNAKRSSGDVDNKNEGGRSIKESRRTKPVARKLNEVSNARLGVDDTPEKSTDVDSGDDVNFLGVHKPAAKINLIEIDDRPGAEEETQTMSTVNRKRPAVASPEEEIEIEKRARKRRSSGSINHRRKSVENAGEKSNADSTRGSLLRTRLLRSSFDKDKDATVRYRTTESRLSANERRRSSADAEIVSQGRIQQSNGELGRHRREPHHSEKIRQPLSDVSQAPVRYNSSFVNDDCLKLVIKKEVVDPEIEENEIRGERSNRYCESYEEGYYVHGNKTHQIRFLVRREEIEDEIKKEPVESEEEICDKTGNENVLMTVKEEPFDFHEELMLEDDYPRNEAHPTLPALRPTVRNETQPVAAAINRRRSSSPPAKAVTLEDNDINYYISLEGADSSIDMTVRDSDAGIRKKVKKQRGRLKRAQHAPTDNNDKNTNEDTVIKNNNNNNYNININVNNYLDSIRNLGNGELPAMLALTLSVPYRRIGRRKKGDPVPPEKESLNCIICMKPFTNRQRLRKHINAHTQAEKFICNDCGRVFYDKHNLYKHITNVHLKLKQFPCPICGKEFKKGSNLNTHISVHTGDQKHRCEKCNKGFVNRCDLEIHMDGHLGIQRYVCSVCNKALYNKKTLEKHMYTHTGTDKFECRVCGKKYSSSGSLKEHVMKHSGVESYTCSICGAKFFYRNGFNRHLRTHEGKKQECAICGKRYQRKEYLKKHMTIHFGMEKFQCQYCLKKFIDKSDYNIHLNTHTKANEYPCEFCKKVYYNKSYLNMHRNIHTGEKDIKCTICNRHFMKKTQLDRHMSIHNGTNKIPCDICDLELSSLASLKRHLFNQHGVDKYSY